MKLKSYRLNALRIILCAALLGANALPAASVRAAPPATMLPDRQVQAGDSFAPPATMLPDRQVHAGDSFAPPATMLPQRQDRAGDSFAPEGPASTGGTFIVNGYGVDTPAYDTVLTLQEALLLARGGTDASGLGRALYDSERQQIIGCTFGGSGGAWTISAGAGWGAAGPQASAMTHVLLGPSGRSKFAVGAGISGGKYSWRPFCVDCDEDAPKTGSVMWGNVEIGGEHRFGSGFALRYFGGYGHIVMGDLTCDPKAGNCPYSPSDGRNLIYTGVALGGAL